MINQTIIKVADGHQFGIYALLFSDDVIKVGFTTRGQLRLDEHEQNERGRRSVVDYHVSPANSREMAEDRMEKDLIAWCHENGELVQGREYFSGLDFLAVAEQMDRICFRILGYQPPLWWLVDKGKDDSVG